jgi:hypothetical protein
VAGWPQVFSPDVPVIRFPFRRRGSLQHLVRQQLAGRGQPIAQVSQVRVDAEFPGVGERLDLLQLLPSM